MEIKIFGNEYQVDNKLANTIILRSQFEENAEEATKKIKEQYYNFGTMKSVVNELPQYGLAIIEEYVNDCLRIFSNNGLHNVDKDAFIEYTEVVDKWVECCNNALYLPLELQRRSKRSLYEAWIHTYPREMEQFPENKIGYSQDELTILKTFDTITAQKFKWELADGLEKMYNSPLVKDFFFEGIGEIVLSLKDCIIDILEEAGIDNYYRILEENVDEAKRLFNNISFVEDKENLLAQILELNPFADYAISYAYETHIGNKEEIKVYANVFSLKIKPLIHLTKVENMLLWANYNDWEELNNTKKTVDEICDTYSIDRTRYDEWLDLKINELQQKIIYFDGVTYPSVEESLNAQKVLKNVTEELLNTNGNDRDVIKKCIEEVESSNILTKEKYLNYLNNALQQANERAKIVFDVRFDEEEVAQLNKKKCKEIYEDLNNIIFNSDEEISEYISKVEQELDERLRKPYLDRLTSLLKLYNESKEMVDKYRSYIPQNRLEETDICIKVDSVYNAMKTLRLNNGEFNGFHDVQLSKYLSFYNVQCNTIDEAIQRYVTLTKHAISYQKTLDDKASTKKKGFFSAIKSSVKNAWNSQYESDYKIVTSNGMSSIPNISDNELNSINSMNGRVKNYTEEKTREIERQVILNPYEAEKVELDLSALTDKARPASEKKTWDANAIMDKIKTFDLKTEISNMFPKEHELDWKAIPKYLQGTVICIRNRNVNVDTPQARHVVLEQLKYFNEYLFYGMSDDEIFDDFKNKVPYVMTTYRYMNHGDEIDQALKEVGLSFIVLEKQTVVDNVNKIADGILGGILG